VPQQYTGSISELWRNVDRGIASPDPLAWMHEHIQHYSQSSLRKLVERNGIEPDKQVLIPGQIMAILGHKK
jgi:hypothetical protein